MGAFAHTLESLSPPTAEATKRGFMKHKHTWKSKSKIVKFLAQGGGGGGQRNKFPKIILLISFFLHPI